MPAVGALSLPPSPHPACTVLQPLAREAPRCWVGQDWGTGRPKGRDLADAQVRPGRFLQGWRPPSMCCLRGTGVCPWPSLSHRPWTRSSPAEGLWPLPCVAGHLFPGGKERAGPAGVGLGAAGGFLSGLRGKGRALPLPGCG